MIWLNDDSGDLFQSVSNGSDGFVWEATGNLKGQRGNIIYTGNADPVFGDNYLINDLYLNIKTNDLFTFTGAQWTKTGNIKGDQGERGSLWFFGQNDPQPSDHFMERDSYLNTLSFDYFVFNGSNWQKTGNIKGNIGLQGEQGIQGLPGNDGAVGKQGETGARGSLWISAAGAPSASKNYKEWDCYLDELTYNIYVNNGSEWQLIGNINGAQGLQGLPGQDGKQGIQGVQGPKGDDGSRWYVGSILPDGSVGMNDPRGKPRVGDQYLYMNTNDNTSSVYIYTDEAIWAGPLGHVSGPVGPEGKQGVQGPQGEAGNRGSLWFNGTNDPVTGDQYKTWDCYLNNTTQDIFIFNGKNWQKTVLSQI